MTDLPGPDGVYGPPKPDFSKERGQASAAWSFIIPLVFVALAALVGGFMVGRTTAPTDITQARLHEYIVSTLENEACMPSADYTIQASDQLPAIQQMGEMVKATLKDQGMTDIQISTGHMTVKDKSYAYGVVSWRNCAAD